MDDIASVDKKLQTGSPQYTTMRERTKDVMDAMRNFTGPFIELENGRYTVSAKLKELKTKVNDAIEACTQYDTYKKNRNAREHKLTLNRDPAHKLSRREKRYVAMLNNMEFLQEQIELFSKLEKQVEDYNDYLRDKSAVNTQVTDKRAAANRQYISEYKIQNDKNQYNNFVSRSEFMVLDTIKKINVAKSREDYATATKEELNFHIKLGFAATGLKADDADRLISKARDESGLRISNDKDELLKKAIAALLLDKKIELTNKNAAEPLTGNKKRVFDQLKAIPLTEGPNAIENVMKTEEFKAFAPQVMGLFKNGEGLEDENEPGLTVTCHMKGCLKNVGVCSSLNEFSVNALAAKFDECAKQLEAQKAAKPKSL